MVVKQTHLIAFLIILAIIAGYVIQDSTNRKEKKAANASNVTLCRSSVERAAYMANGFDLLARSAKSPRQAQDRQAVAISIRSTFPGPAKKDGRVERVEQGDGTVTFALTAESDALIEKGCRQLYK